MPQSELVKQRVKYLLQEGGVYPEDKPATHRMLMWCAAAIILLQVVALVVHLFD